MLVIAIQSPKGGVSKSTTSVSLARAFQKMGYAVALGETDPQGTLREWFADNDAQDVDLPKVVQLLSKDAILGIFDNTSLENIDILVIDGVANGFKEFISVSKVADLVVLITTPSPTDVKPLGDIVDVLEGKGKVAVFLMTKTKKGDDLTDIIRESLTDFGLPVLKNTIRDLKGFKTSWGVGRTVFEYKEYDHAQKDVMAVAEELLELVGGE